MQPLSTEGTIPGALSSVNRGNAILPYYHEQNECLGVLDQRPTKETTARHDKAMAALGAATSILAIVQLAGEVSVAATSFMRDVRKARADMIKVKRDLSNLSALLKIIAEVIRDDAASSASVLQNTHIKINSIASSCHAVILEIGDVIGSNSSRLFWATYGKARVDGLLANLEIHVSSLDVALDLLSIIICSETKENTTRILDDTYAIRQDMTDILDKLEHIQQKLPIRQDTGVYGSPFGVMLDRFLYELRNDAETVLSSIDYQQVVFEDNPAQPQPDALTSTPPSLPILFEDNRKRLFTVPFEACTTWSDMEDIIKQSCSDTTDSEEVEKGNYYLVSGEGQYILPNLWDKVVAPGLRVRLNIWQGTGQDMASNAAEEGTSMGQRETWTGREETDVREEEAAESEAPISFESGAGREASSPWHLDGSWSGMEVAIEEVLPNGQPEQEARRELESRVYRAQIGPPDQIHESSPLISGSHRSTPIEGGWLDVPGSHGATNPDSKSNPSGATTGSSSHNGTAREDHPTKTRRSKPGGKARSSFSRNVMITLGSAPRKRKNGRLEFLRSHAVI